MPYIKKINHRVFFKGNDDQKNGGAEKRKSQVLRYIMDCSEEHVKLFLNILYARVYDNCDLGGGSAIDYILASKPAPHMYNSKISTIINNTNLIVTTLEQFMASNRGYILEIILWIGYLAESKDQWSPANKNIRNDSYKLLILFCYKFPDHEYTDKVVEAIFQCFVWRNLMNFYKFTTTPHALLKLVLVWAKNREFHR